MLGHMDPVLHDLMLELVELLREAYRARDGLVLPLQATGTSGMEAGIANLVEPGDTVVVGASGYFGRRIIQMARRHGAEVIEVMEDWGVHVPNGRLVDALDRHPDASLLAVVHAETSTGTLHPLQELGEAMRGRETLLMADCVTSLGGVEVDVGAWGIDYAYSCTQKCLGAPPGMSPIAVSERALERFHARETPVPFSFDFDLLAAYWVRRPAAYHHTCPTLHIYALHQVLRGLLDEGIEARWARHEAAGRHFQRRAQDAGLELLAEPGHQLPQLSAVRVPEGVDAKAVQRALLEDHDVEIGAGLGPEAPDIWRIGLMGPNASTDTADRVLNLLTTEIERRGAAVAG
jgi:alanine-glyoxylate transaminase/serine-glyoxylate transaminase/serine-pyruvate transaminase